MEHCPVCGKVLANSVTSRTCTCGYSEWFGPYYLNKEPATMIPTKDQIEAAAVAHGYEKWENYKYNEQRWAKEDFIVGALWMQALMEKLKEQWQREAWEAARMVTLKGDAYELEAGMFMKICGGITKCEFADETFEDWKKTQ